MLNYELSQNSLENSGTVINEAIKRLYIGQITQTFPHITSHASHQLSKKTVSGTVGKQGKGFNTISVYEKVSFP